MNRSISVTPVSEWVPSAWALFGNSIPHFTFKFKSLENAHFEPYTAEYQEVSTKPELVKVLSKSATSSEQIKSHESLRLCSY